MANVGRKGTIRYEETFATHNLGTGVQGLDRGTETGEVTLRGIAWVQNIGTSDTPLALTASATKGLHIAGSLAATNDNMIDMKSYMLPFYGQTGFNAVDVLLQVDQASSMAFAFGFSSVNTGSIMRLPVQLTTATWASTGSTFCGIVKDFGATNDELHCFWVDDDVDTVANLADLRMKGLSFVKDKWLYMRVEMQDQGSGNPVRATFHAQQDGKHVTKEFNTTVDRDSNMCFYLGVANRAAIARGIAIKAPGWEQSIAD